MTLLALLLIHAMLSRKAYSTAHARSPEVAKVAAILSLALWIGVVIAGRGIGYNRASRPEAVIELFGMRHLSHSEVRACSGC